MIFVDGMPTPSAIPFSQPSRLEFVLHDLPPAGSVVCRKRDFAFLRGNDNGRGSIDADVEVEKILEPQSLNDDQAELAILVAAALPIAPTGVDTGDALMKKGGKVFKCEPQRSLARAERVTCGLNCKRQVWCFRAPREN